MIALVEEFNRFAELFLEPMLLVSSSGHLCGANSSAQRTLLGNAGPDPEQVIFNLVEDAPNKVAEYLRNCSRTAQPLPGLFSFRNLRAQATKFRSLGCAFRARDAQQRPLVILRFAAHDSSSRFIALNQQIEKLKVEVSRRVNAERTLARERELLQVTLSSIGDGVIVTDVVGRVTFMNPVAEAHVGRRESECRGAMLEEVFIIRNEKTGEPVENPVQKVLRTGKTVALANHTVLIRPNGEDLPIDDTAAPIIGATGKLFGVVLVFHEISESRKLQHELMRQTDALREADRRKDEFLAVLAHELRNPLAPLRNGLQLARLKMGPESPLIPNVEMMGRQLLHLVRLVNDLMDVSRVSRGIIELRRAPVYVKDALARSIEASRSEMEARRHELQLRLCPENIAVMGDADRLAQIFSNLLVNSAKYSPEGALIQLSMAQDGTDVVIHVTDNGIGIPPEYLEHVFEMFSQVRIHQGRSEGGLGIGLSLVRTLVEMHGGSINAHSEGVGTGSTFTVRLPQSTARVDDSTAAPPRAEISPRSLRILVADDNSDSANSLRSLLELAGHEVRTASTGHEVEREVDAFRPALVFMDIGMPDMDGLEATRRIRQRPRGKDIVIVALTGWGQPQDRERTKLAGVDRHIVKPIGPEDLAEVIALASEP